MQYAPPSSPRRLPHRDYVAAQVRRLADLLEEWEAWEVDQHLAPAERRFRRPPTIGREAAAVLHRALLDELHDLDGAIWSALSHGPA